MKESYTEDPASHGDPESCVGVRKDVGEALTGERIGEVLSREIKRFGVLTMLSEWEGNIMGVRNGKHVLDPARSETLCMYGRFLHGNREIPWSPASRWWGAGRAGKTEVTIR